MAKRARSRRKALLWCVGAFLALALCVGGNSGASAQSDSDAGDWPRRVAERCKGEAYFAIAPCGCVVKNRLAAGIPQEDVLEAFYAEDVAAKDAEVWLAERVLTGYWPCDPRMWFMFSADDVARLGLNECDALEVRARRGWRVLFYERDALDD